MSYLLDTDVISEPSRKKPDSRVISWFDLTPPEKLFVSVLIAATALHHNLTLVTINSRDFDYHGLQVFDPWS